MSKTWDAWFKFYPRDYMEKTRALSLEQRGAYMDCICMQMMTEAPIQDDYAWLAHQMHVSSRKAKTIVESLIEACKLRRSSEGIVNDRCLFELESKLNQRRVNAENAANRARKSGENQKSANENNDARKISQTERVDTRARTDTDTDTEKKKKRAPSGAAASATEETAKGTRLPKTWQLPADWHAWAVEHLQIDARQCESEAQRFVDYWADLPGQKGRKVDWAGTWRNWLRRNYAERGAHVSAATAKRPPPYWWRDRPDSARTLPDDVWRKAVTSFANGVWPIETLGPPPGAEGCLIPATLITELHLAEIYDEKGAKRS